MENEEAAGTGAEGAGELPDSGLGDTSELAAADPANAAAAFAATAGSGVAGALGAVSIFCLSDRASAGTSPP